MRGSCAQIVMKSSRRFDLDHGGLRCKLSTYMMGEERSVSESCSLKSTQFHCVKSKSVEQYLPLFGSWHERNTRPPALNATTQAMPSWRWPFRDLFLLSFEPSIWKNCYLGEHRLVAILAPEDFIHSVILVRQESIIFLWRYKRNWILYEVEKLWPANSSEDCLQSRHWSS